MIMIKYLVISSGAHKIIKQFSTIYTLIENKFIDLNNIEKIYGTSSGSIIALILSLKLDIKIVYDYLLNRPWEKLYKIDTDRLLNSYNNNGIFNIDILLKSLEPLLKLIKLQDNFTFKDIYEYSGKQLNFYATNCNDLNTEEFSYKKTPNFSVMKAVYMSCSIPLIFKPIKYNNIFYLDGALSTPFPMNEFLKDNSGCDLDEIFGLDISFDQSYNHINDNNMLDFNIELIYNCVTKWWIMKKNKNIEKIKNIIYVNCGEKFFLKEMFDIVNKKEKRLQYFESGKKDAEDFLKSMDYL
tara:strand:+ start:1801 stop:2691 length:891 start_codon:yes stop_codon:yes gene_type:complete